MPGTSDKPPCVRCISQILSFVFLRYCHLYFSDIVFLSICNMYFSASCGFPLGQVKRICLVTKSIWIADDEFHLEIPSEERLKYTKGPSCLKAPKQLFGSCCLASCMSHDDDDDDDGDDGYDDGVDGDDGDDANMLLVVWGKGVWLY